MKGQDRAATYRHRVAAGRNRNGCRHETCKWRGCGRGTTTFRNARRVGGSSAATSATLGTYRIIGQCGNCPSTRPQLLQHSSTSLFVPSTAPSMIPAISLAAADRSSSVDLGRVPNHKSRLDWPSTTSWAWRLLAASSLGELKDGRQLSPLKR